MKWIEIDSTSSGADRINIERCDRYKLITPTQIQFLFGASSTTLTFASADDATAIYKKLKEFTNSTNINKIP